MKHPELQKLIVVTVADRRFLPAACCTLISARQNLPADANVSLILLAVDVTDEEITQANGFLQLHHIDHCITPVSADMLLSQGLHVDERVTRASYVRLALDKLIDPGAQKVLYLDADTRVMTSLLPLLQTDLKDYTFAAAHGMYFYAGDRLSEKNHSLGLPADTDYCNSGVLLFNWQQVIRRGLLPDARDFAEKHPEKCSFYDQDALNAVIAGEYLQLDPRWNLVHYYFKNGGKKSAWIKHFTGIKPWKRQRPAISSGDALWYQRLLAGSPWSEFVERLSWLEKIGTLAQEHRGSTRNYRQIARYCILRSFTTTENQEQVSKSSQGNNRKIIPIVDRWMRDITAVDNPENRD